MQRDGGVPSTAAEFGDDILIAEVPLPKILVNRLLPGMLKGVYEVNITTL